MRRGWERGEGVGARRYWGKVKKREVERDIGMGKGKKEILRK